MTTIYHGLLEKLQRHPQRIVADQRLRLSSMRKGIVALRARRLKSRAHAQPASMKQASASGVPRGRPEPGAPTS